MISGGLNSLEGDHGLLWRPPYSILDMVWLLSKYHRYHFGTKSLPKLRLSITWIIKEYSNLLLGSVLPASKSLAVADSYLKQIFEVLLTTWTFLVIISRNWLMWNKTWSHFGKSVAWKLLYFFCSSQTQYRKVTIDYLAVKEKIYV